MTIKINLLLLLSLSLFINGYGQTKLPVDEEGNIKFDSIIHIDSVQALDLYNKALYWFGKNYKSPKDAIKMQIPDSYTIIANGITDLIWPMPLGDRKSKLGFKITIACKDNRYRFTIEDLMFYDISYGAYPSLISTAQKSKTKGAEKARHNILLSMKEVIASLKNEMTKKENW